MTVCPACGQPMDLAREAGRLLVLLTTGVPHREVYRAADGSGWYVTYGGGRFSWAAVDRLIRDGHIHSRYSDCPEEMYHVGKTLDCSATLEGR